jgi:preprotein translocase subunit SecF
MQFKFLLLTVVVFVALLNTALAKGIQQEIKFKPGKSSTTIKGTVLSSDRDEYTLAAKAGQVMSVSITAEEDNAVFQIYRKKVSGWEPLEGAAEDDNATQWEDKLLGKGNERLKIVVGGKRGNATYTLEVAIK